MVGGGGDAKDNNLVIAQLNITESSACNFAIAFGEAQRYPQIKYFCWWALASLWRTGASVYHLHHTDSCTTQTSCFGRERQYLDFHSKDKSHDLVTTWANKLRSKHVGNGRKCETNDFQCHIKVTCLNEEKYCCVTRITAWLHDT